MKKAFQYILIMSVCLFSLYPIYAFAADFPDVPKGHRNYDAVNYLTEKGVIAGYEDGSFLPSREITRTEFCALMARTMGYSKNSYKTAKLPFSDIPSGYWGEAYISFCYEMGLINGMGDGTFAPAAKVTVEQTVKMAVCAVGAEKDAKAAAGEKWYSGYIDAAKNLGILSGVELSIGQNALRGNVAQLVYNADRSGKMIKYSGSISSEEEPEEEKSELEKAYDAKDFTDVHTIVIDAGHNYDGKDLGARNDALGIREEILTFQIADKLRAKLEAMGYTVIMTRKTAESSIANTSTSDSLRARVDAAHDALADLFISIHCNTGGGMGAETYCFENSGYSGRLAKLVQKHITGETSLYDRGVKTAGFFVIKNTLMPAVLVETGFIDNESDAAFLTSWEGQEKLAAAIAAAVKEYDGMGPIAD